MQPCCPPSENSPLRVEIHTGTHLILGAVEVQSRQGADLGDLLASGDWRVKGARIQPLQRAKVEGYRQADDLPVSRDDIRICIPYGCSSAPHGDTAEGKQPPIRAVPVTLHLGAMQIDGQVYAEEGLDALGAAQNGKGPFLVVVQARIRYLDEALSLPFTAETVLVNRAHVQQVAPQDDAERPMSRLRKLLTLARA